MLLFFFVYFDDVLRRSIVEKRRLAFLLAGERFFGRRPWMWEDLAKMGLTLNRQEARNYLHKLGDQLPPDRAALYEYLFQKHPELRLASFTPEEIAEKIKVQRSETVDPLMEGLSETQAEGLQGELDDNKPNAVIFRLGADGPGGMSQQDTCDVVLNHADQPELWVPIDSRASFDLAANLERVGGILYLAFGNRLVLRLEVDECRQNLNERIDFRGSLNPWEPYGITTSYRWVRVKNVRAVDISEDNFLLKHGERWNPGFPNRNSLALAIVTEP